MGIVDMLTGQLVYMRKLPDDRLQVLLYPDFSVLPVRDTFFPKIHTTTVDGLKQGLRLILLWLR